MSNWPHTEAPKEKAASSVRVENGVNLTCYYVSLIWWLEAEVEQVREIDDEAIILHLAPCGTP